MSEPLSFTFSKKVACADADGKPIHKGSVLKNIEDGARGVVTEIGVPGHVARHPFFALGDLNIQLSAGCSRVTNCYSKWKHIPHDDQTYKERHLSWMVRPYYHDDFKQVSRDEGLAIEGIMALLPSDTVDHDYGPWPDRLEDALRFLVNHISELSAKKGSTDENAEPGFTCSEDGTRAEAEYRAKKGQSD